MNHIVPVFVLARARVCVWLNVDGLNDMNLLVYFAKNPYFSFY